MSENSELVFRAGEHHMFSSKAHTQSNEINRYLKICVEITVLYIIEMLLILQWKAFDHSEVHHIIQGKRVRRKMIPNSW